jgi:alpha-ketoglutarate-dependent taurine dioxygenase
MTGLPELRQFGEALGPEAHGIDLSALNDATFAGIERTCAEHPVLVFCDQHLGAEDFATFGRRFDAPRIYALDRPRL